MDAEILHRKYNDALRIIERKYRMREEIDNCDLMNPNVRPEDPSPMFAVNRHRTLSNSELSYVAGDIDALSAEHARSIAYGIFKRVMTVLTDGDPLRSRRFLEQVAADENKMKRRREATWHY